MNSFPDPRTLTDQQLIELIDVLARDEQETAYLRGVAERRISLLRAELTRRSGDADDPLS